MSNIYILYTIRYQILIWKIYLYTLFLFTFIKYILICIIKIFYHNSLNFKSIIWSYPCKGFRPSQMMDEFMIRDLRGIWWDTKGVIISGWCLECYWPMQLLTFYKIIKKIIIWEYCFIIERCLIQIKKKCVRISMLIYCNKIIFVLEN